MEDWLYYSLCLILCLTLSYFLSSVRPATTGKPAAITPSLPPGLPPLTALGPFVLFGWTNYGIELIIRTARSWYGRVFTIYFLSTPVIFVADRDVARHVLVQRGAAFADRPPANATTRIFSDDLHTITSAAYGPLWRVLRGNLTAKVLHPSCLRRYAVARRRAVAGLIAGISRQMMREDQGVVVVEELLHGAMFHVLASMCFGDGLDDGVVAAIAALQREFLTSVVGFQVFGAFPAVTKLVYRRRFERMLSIRRRQNELFVPLIRARKAWRDSAGDGEDFQEECYADSLLGLRIPENGGTRNLTEGEMACLCSELLASGTDSTVAVMQWAMANLVARPEIQAKLRAEIDHVIAGAGAAAVEEEHLQQMPYLRAVVLEALRRHPPGRFMLPHAATEAGATLDGFDVPRHASVNFTLTGMAWDGEVWPEPKRFRPERFLPGGEGEDLDLTGRKEIKMMPFSAGRRMCPGMEMALMHLEYFVANLVRELEWKEVPGEPVDFTERLEMSLVMKRPLRAIVVPRMHTHVMG
jgi:cytochrome P450